MPSIDNSFLASGANAKQEISSKVAAPEQKAAKADKPFSQHLQEEMEGNKVAEKVADAAPSDEVEKDKRLESDPDDTETQLQPALGMVNADDDTEGNIEENNLLLAGKLLPVEQAIDESIQDQNAQFVSVIAAEVSAAKEPVVAGPISLMSKKSVDMAQPEVELMADELTEADNQLDIPVTKEQKVTLENQLLNRQESVSADVIKMVRTVAPQGLSANTAGYTEAAKTPDNTATQIQLSTPLASKQWGGEFTQRISMMITNGQQQVAEMRLNPAHLGSVSVRLHIEDDQANISFVTHNQAVKDAIEASLPRLKEQLQQQGLDLGNVDVSTKNQDESTGDAGTGYRQGGFANENTVPNDTVTVVPLHDQISEGVSVFV